MIPDPKIAGLAAFILGSLLILWLLGVMGVSGVPNLSF